MSEARRTAGRGTPNGQSGRSQRQTERKFILAATDLFADKGYNGTSISDLAGQLGLTTASLYYHVSGKQELLLRVLETGMADFLDRLEAIAKEEATPREKLRLAVENHLHFVLTRQKAVTVFLRERRFLEPANRNQYDKVVNRYDDLFTTLIQEAMDASQVPRGDATLVRLSILGMINWVVEWYKPGGRLGPRKITKAMTTLIMDQMLAKHDTTRRSGETPRPSFLSE